MCSSRGLCGRGERAADRPARSESTGSGAHYALCALGVGLIALGVVMIVWTVIPVDGEASGAPTNNTTAAADDDSGGEGELSKSSSVAMVLVGVGLAMLLLSICLGIRSKRRANDNESSQQTATAAAAAFLDHVPGEQEDVPDPTTFSVPSYDEVVGSSDYPVRQSNLRQSNTHLPSYEDIIAAVENEGAEPPAEDAPLSVDAPSPATQPDAARQPSLPARTSSRASRLLRPLRVRRIKSDKLHLKDFRIQIRSPTTNPVTIEPITPPPLYDNKSPELD